ncbi:hypothetical protein AKJ16_DCAP16097 [Drosera capensis]
MLGSQILAKFPLANPTKPPMNSLILPSPNPLNVLPHAPPTHAPSPTTTTSDRLRLVIDASSLKHKTLTILHSKRESFISSGTDAIEDIRTLVTVDSRERIIVSCKGSTVRFLGEAVMLGFVGVVVVRWVAGLRWKGRGDEGVVVKRRDRSLGGREVVVGVRERRGKQEVVEGRVGERREEGGEEEEVARVVAGGDGGGKGDDAEGGQSISQRIILVVAFRVGYGVPEWVNTFSQLVDEDPRSFLGGLADNIGLSSSRASVVVAAVVAARTRLWFLQAWALEMRGKHSGALEELSKICIVHQIFPPESSSMMIIMYASCNNRDYCNWLFSRRATLNIFHQNNMFVSIRSQREGVSPESFSWGLWRRQSQERSRGSWTHTSLPLASRDSNFLFPPLSSVSAVLVPQFFGTLGYLGMGMPSAVGIAQHVQQSIRRGMRPYISYNDPG